MNWRLFGTKEFKQTLTCLKLKKWKKFESKYKHAIL